MKLIKKKSTSISPNFWNQKYIDNKDKWSLNTPTPIFEAWFQKIRNKKNILIPGAGKGDDGFYLSSKGHNVYALDYSIEAIKIMQARAFHTKSTIKILHKNIFDLSQYYGKFDIFLEYTCFCAILPEQRERYIKESSKFLKKGGCFVGILFPINKPLSDEGPPFGVDFNQTMQLFKKYYKVKECNMFPDSIGPRSSQEVFICLENV